jgi:hypothetical protein
MHRLGETWIGPEEAAYPHGSLRRSARYGVVRCSDGKLRRAKLGIPDTFFSIPARLKVSGKTVAGFVTSGETCSDGSTEYYFCAYKYRKNHTALPEKPGSAYREVSK